MMEFNECLLSRKSIRHFTDEKVNDSIIENIINAGIYAPSACNFEAWKFIVVNNETKNKKDLCNNIAINAPYVIIVTYRNDIYVTGRKYKDYIQSASAAIENMLLYINSINLGGVWICGINNKKKLKKSFNIPKNFDVIALIAFGHPSEEENTNKDMIYHYGDEKSFIEHKRKYGVNKVMCKDKFYKVEDDCTYSKYPKKKELIIKNIKEKLTNIKNI